MYGRFRVKGVAVKEGVYVETKSDYLPKANALLSVVEDTIEEHIFDDHLYNLLRIINQECSK